MYPARMGGRMSPLRSKDWAKSVRSNLHPCYASQWGQPHVPPANKAQMQSAHSPSPHQPRSLTSRGQPDLPMAGSKQQLQLAQQQAMAGREADEEGECDVAFQAGTGRCSQQEG